MSTAKRHHTVPQFYLRGFSRADQIATVRLPGDLRFVQSVRKAAAEMNFYSVEGHEDGPDAFEKLLGSVEGEAAKVFTSVADGVWPLAPHDRELLAYYIALQAVRGPEQRRNMEFFAAQVARLEIGFGGRSNVRDWVQRKRGRSISVQEAALVWEQATRPEGPPIRLSPVAHVRQMVGMAAEIVRYVAGRPWTLVRCEELSLVTCDTPVGLIPHSGEEPGSGVGFMTAWGLSFPLSRKLGLLMSDPLGLAEAGVPVELVRSGSLDVLERESLQMQQLLNRITIDSASLWLYHHPDDAAALPKVLPEPSPVTMGMSGGAFGFPDEQPSGSPAKPPTEDGPAG